MLSMLIKAAKPRTRSVLVVGLILCCLQFVAAQETPESSYQVKTIVEGQLGIELSPPRLRCAIDNRIGIKLGRQTVHTIYAAISYYDDHGELLAPEYKEEEKIVYGDDGRVFVAVAPERVGKARLELLINLENGEEDIEDRDVEVVLPDQLPDKFMIAQGGSYTKEDVGSVYLDLSRFTKAFLGPRALYKGAKRSVDLPVKDVSYSLITEPGRDSSVSLDNATGTITALHSGRVLVEAKFREMSVLTCVDVGDSTEDEVRRHDCDDMVPEGMTIRHPLDRVKELHSKQVPDKEQ